MLDCQEYRLFEKINRDCIAVDDTSEIIRICNPQCIYDNTDGWCKCFVCNKEYNMYNKNEADEFDQKHELLIKINDFEIFKHKEVK